MKKVLALVLAVIMVCTVALADNLNTNDKTTGYTIISVGESDSAVAAIEFTYADNFDFDETYVLTLNREYFEAAGVKIPTGKTLKDVVTVSGLNGVWAKDGTAYYLVIPVADKALDGKADFTIGSFTIKMDATNYAEFSAKDGKVVMTKLVVGGLNKAVVAVGTNNEKALDAAYDVGFKANETFAGANGWYYTKDKAIEKYEITGLLTLSVPAKTYFKFTMNADSATPTLKTKDNMQTSATIKGAAVTAGSLTLTVPGDKDTIIYGMDKNGKLYANPTTLVVTADADGVETGAWTATGTSIMNVATFAKTEAGVANATTGTGTTTNPGTGANDVVGVAAALAVVALVSGAAISLKK